MQTTVIQLKEPIMYTCEKHQPITNAEGIREAAQIIAMRKAKAAYGRNGYARTCVLDSYSQDGSVAEFCAFIGYRSAPYETTGHSVRFTVTARA